MVAWDRPCFRIQALAKRRLCEQRSLAIPAARAVADASNHV